MRMKRRGGGGEIWASRSEPLGRWHGVTVNAQGRVVHLQLDSFKIAGESPAIRGQVWRIARPLASLDLWLVPKGLSSWPVDARRNSLAGHVPRRAMAEDERLHNVPALRGSASSTSGRSAWICPLVPPQSSQKLAARP